ncbi:HdeD family acid-resistance protein [Primorskyibacter marinus]|uniref:HdeD family acid-resistance protein n=1 Tax=Primorskyibacter marinus TaxID=1977320 RepID=UPI000E3034A9|nr:DUF308 domain-containing protein [Primorskyibacter marinus]
MKLWVKWLVFGVISIAFGIFVLANPIAASIAVTTLAGILFVLSGGFQIYAGIGEEHIWGKLLGIGLGALMLLLGLSLAFQPFEGTITLSILVTVLFAASGIFRLITAYQMRRTQFFWPMLISGAVSVLLAGYITANFFAVALGLLGVLLGIELLFNGASLVLLAFFLRTVKGDVRDRIEARMNKKR